VKDFLNWSDSIQKHCHLLPHWQQNNAWIFVTWRLADSLPTVLLVKWREEREEWLNFHPEPWDTETEIIYHKRFSNQIDEWLDAGSGSCVLAQARCAEVVAAAFHHFEGIRYLLDCYVVMPNHVHVLFRPLGDHKLENIIHSWKRHSSRVINQMLEKNGTLWMADYWDRLIRNELHFKRIRDYILTNPAKLPTGTYVVYRAVSTLEKDAG
jgi:REP element-mobilizing transposase RayT